ncbi:hypothetical protein FO519_000532 [Halicephalobus sp. NKZ332]|nr:hypothetical protein FO519_000532 [Halicephalobus sp. NKZ332]
MDYLAALQSPFHKAILILDRGPKFAKFSEIECEVSYKDGTKQNKIGLAPKTLWNCSIDAAVEFQRIVTDVLPSGTHHTRFLISEVSTQLVYERWHSVALNQDEFIQALFERGCADVNPEIDPFACSVVNSLSRAIECFNEYTPWQRKAHDILKNMSFGPTSIIDYHTAVEQSREIEPHSTNRVGYQLENNCTLFIITSFNDVQKEFEYFCESVVVNMNDKNRIIDEAASGTQVPIHSLHVFVLNVANDFSTVPADVAPISRSLNDNRVICTIYTISGRGMNAYLRRVIMEAYNLISTTISGIPMKEESSPFNTSEYDVEILHPRALHKHLETAGLLNSGSAILQPAPEGGYSTVKLRWCNPVQKLRKDAYPLREEGLYATPVDALGRPTLCVTGFLRKGKSIWLEAVLPDNSLAENVPGKIITHMLTFDVYRSGMLIQSLSIGEKLETQQFMFKHVLNKDVSPASCGISTGAELTDDFLNSISERCNIEVESKEERIFIDESDPYLEMKALSVADDPMYHTDGNGYHIELVRDIRRNIRRDGHVGENLLYFTKEEKYSRLYNNILSKDPGSGLVVQDEIKTFIKEIEEGIRKYNKTKEEKFRMDKYVFVIYDILIYLSWHKENLYDQYLFPLCNLLENYMTVRKTSVDCIVTFPPVVQKSPERLEPLCFRPGFKIELYKGQVFEDDPAGETPAPAPEKPSRKRAYDSDGEIIEDEENGTDGSEVEEGEDKS